MSYITNSKDLKEQTSIVGLLSRLGYEPMKKRGKEHMYRSMLREGDLNPSFCVDDKLGLWYDHGNGQGGNIIDFGMAYWPTLNFYEVLEKIQGNSAESKIRRIYPPSIADKVKNYTIDGHKEIGTHPAITGYLAGRNVLDTARIHLKEIYYSVKSENGKQQQYFAAGWQNEAGSWEVRNKYFKGCLGSKAISFIAGDPKQVSVFEGFFNYLSWMKENRSSQNSAIVLNSLSFLNEGVRRAKQFSFIDLYLDRDPSGFKATEYFLEMLPYATDRSEIYKDYNDYNDKLVESLRQAEPEGNFPRQQRR